MRPAVNGGSRAWTAAAGLAAALLCIAGAARATPPEDEAHRLDRLRTQELNAAALKRHAPPPPAALVPSDPVRAPALAPPPTPEEQALRQREERALAAWRARVAACRAGDRPSCDPR